MASHQVFLQAILDHPQADEPRMHYADWLDDCCHPRGEFIRVQYRLAEALEANESCFELETREKEILDEFEREWSDPLADLVDFWAFQRGFIEEIALTPEAFLVQAEKLFRIAPIQEIHFHHLGREIPALTASPHLGRARFLDFSSNYLGDSGLLLLAQSPHLAKTQGLNLSNTGISDAGVFALAASPSAANLRELFLDFNRITDQGGRALAGSPYLKNLASLFLSFNPISREGQRILLLRFGKQIQF